MKTLILAFLLVSGTAYGACENGHEVTHDVAKTADGVTVHVDHGVTEFCLNVANAERDAINNLNKDVPIIREEKKRCKSSGAINSFFESIISDCDF